MNYAFSVRETSAVIDDYMTCALWSEIGEDGEPLDSAYTTLNLAPETVRQVEADVRDFLDLLERELTDDEAATLRNIGHDFLLTRNRHGAGFWDRGYGELGDRLTKWVHPYGEFSLYVGDDGLIYGA